MAFPKFLIPTLLLLQVSLATVHARSVAFSQLSDLEVPQSGIMNYEYEYTPSCCDKCVCKNKSSSSCVCNDVKKGFCPKSCSLCACSRSQPPHCICTNQIKNCPSKCTNAHHDFQTLLAINNNY
ncbi:horsegram inhibitor 1-like [Cannabis sativa]|uniref:horsegram inhibitor 1-like n=1 Tax=Cannabis sativa TaxID=3483 RepID=UPI0029C9C366|nr:horsegram inhibitor 1-like [Cannabis sativa]